MWFAERSHSKEILAKEDLTLKKAYEILLGMETANHQARELQASAKSATAAMLSAVRDAVQRVAQPQQPKPNSAGLYSHPVIGVARQATPQTGVSSRLRSVEVVAHSQSVQIRRQEWSTGDSKTQCHQIQIVSKETTGWSSCRMYRAE